VFSPYYARARRRRDADPFEHCAINVVLSGPRRRWSMTERGQSCVQADSRSLIIGDSALRWIGGALHIEIRERCCPVPSRILGSVTVRPLVTPGCCFSLDACGRHAWWPLAPKAAIEVSFTHPRLLWSGTAYLDANAGSRPLEQDFRGWSWSRSALASGSAVFYELQPRSEPAHSLSLLFDAEGAAKPLTAPPLCPLPASRWGIARSTRCEQSAAGEPAAPRILQTTVDAPFYARSLLRTRIAGQEVTTVHESLDLDRFSRPWVQCLLPFRMPRWPLIA
jgi:carotenoid 1,2-hydratase